MRTLTVSTLLLISATVVFAKVWTVDNNPGNTAADFTTLNAAVSSSSVQDGDTLYLAGSTLSYGDADITKRLTIIGPGFYLDENIGTQAYLQSARAGSIFFGSGSDSSLIMGVQMTGLSINATYITVKRNLIRSSSAAQVSIPPFINAVANNITLIQNYIINSGLGTGNRVIQIPSNQATNIIISNNYIGHSAATATASTAIDADGGSDVHISNNVIRGNVTLDGTGTFSSNILREGNFSFASGTTGNNLGNSTQFGSGVDMTTVFELTGSTDAQWKLKAGSPAISAGAGGVDAGMYGGATPYVLSGVPPLPAIYELTVPVTGSTSLPVTIKVRSNN